MTVKEAETQLRHLFALAQDGHEVIIEEPGAGKAKLVPVHEAGRKARVFGLHSGQAWTADDFDKPLPDSSWSRASEQ